MGRRTFVDFWLRPPDLNVAKEMCKRAYDLGYSVLVVEVPKTMLEELESGAKEYGLELYSKVVAPAKTRSDVLKAATKFRHSYDVLTVHCLTRDAALVALRDGRVDTVVFRASGFMAFDRHMLSVTRNHIELVIADVISDKVALQKMRSIVRLIDTKGLNVIFSSCASNPVEQRGPFEVSCIVNVLGLNFERSLDALSTTPLNILIRNRAKLFGEMVQEGVWLVKE
ncbi:MAG: RNase P subunit p30 family protein [Nitrososphaerota archaeon]|nr:RNase P subunit p30 family protein [Aigarchaeota archaeon]MDW8076400.1 RNase P subunit p30 family protein [Nitrososphaerota archaeon]